MKMLRGKHFKCIYVPDHLAGHKKSYVLAFISCKIVGIHIFQDV